MAGLTKKALKEMTTEEIIWEFAILATSNPIPSKRERRETDMYMRELGDRGAVDYDKLVEQGKRKFLL